MRINKQELLGLLKNITKSNIVRVERFLSNDNEILNFKEAKDNWSILECIEHLNLYASYYNPEIDNSIKNGKISPKTIFKSGIIGNYFFKSMLPKEQLNKMKTFKDKNPNGSNLDKNIIHRFIKQQHDFIALLDQAKEVDLTKTKTSISISAYIKLRLGDTFRFLVAHNDRHIVQAEKVLKIASNN